MKILKFNFELHFIRNKAYHKKQNVGVCFDVTDFFIWHKIKIKMKHHNVMIFFMFLEESKHCLSRQ